MIKDRIKKLRHYFNKYKIDGYVIPKNDEYFSEYSEVNRLNTISNFSGSAGIAIILKNKNYLFVDGRYTLQAKIESGKYFTLVSYDKIINCKLYKNLTLGIDSKLLTSSQVKNYFSKYNKVKIIDNNLIDKIAKREDPSEMKIAVNELGYHILKGNISKVYFWINWILEWDKSNTKKYGTYDCAYRLIRGIENKYHKNVI